MLLFCGAKGSFGSLIAPLIVKAEPPRCSAANPNVCMVDTRSSQTIAFFAPRCPCFELGTSAQSLDTRSNFAWECIAPVAVSLSHLLRRPWRALRKLQRTWHASLSVRKECLGGSRSSPSLAPECEGLSDRDLRGDRLLYLWVVSRSWLMLSVSQLEADLEFVASQSQAGLCSLGSRPASSLPAEAQSKIGTPSTPPWSSGTHA